MVGGSQLTQGASLECGSLLPLFSRNKKTQDRSPIRMTKRQLAAHSKESHIASEFGWRVGLKEEGDSSNRMAESELKGVQSKPAERILRAAVGAISNNRMAHFGQMSANLIFPAGLECHFEHG